MNKLAECERYYLPLAKKIRPEMYDRIVKALMDYYNHPEFVAGRVATIYWHRLMEYLRKNKNKTF